MALLPEAPEQPVWPQPELPARMRLLEARELSTEALPPRRAAVPGPVAGLPLQQEAQRAFRVFPQREEPEVERQWAAPDAARAPQPGARQPEPAAWPQPEAALRAAPQLQVDLAVWPEQPAGPWSPSPGGPEARADAPIPAAVVSAAS